MCLYVYVGFYIHGKNVKHFSNINIVRATYYF